MAFGAIFRTFVKHILPLILVAVLSVSYLILCCVEGKEKQNKSLFIG
jgi:hypothetical protein